MFIEFLLYELSDVIMDFFLMDLFGYGLFLV